MRLRRHRRTRPELHPHQIRQHCLRCEKTEPGFAAIVALALSFILIKSVRTD
jgi:hypothetical protein